MDHFLYLINAVQHSSKGAIMALLIHNRSKDSQDATGYSGLAFGPNWPSVTATPGLSHTASALRPAQVTLWRWTPRRHSSAWALTAASPSLSSRDFWELKNREHSHFPCSGYPQSHDALASLATWTNSIGSGAALWGYRTSQCHLGNH